MSSIAHLAEKFINQSNKNVFLTGKAGTGKTTFLKEIVATSHKKMVVVAPTGIAAINAEGVTIHSMFQLPFGAFLPVDNISEYTGGQINSRSHIRRNFRLGGIKQKLLKELELLIIDEVSMLRSDLLDAIDFVLRFTRKKSNLAFGGVQVLFIGDLLQLPPVVKNGEWNYLKSYYSSSFFFDAVVIRDNPPVYIELDKVYRQQDEKFIHLLNNFREDKVSKEDITLLNEHFQADFSSGVDDEFIMLTTHNRKADDLNMTKLKEISGETFKYKAWVDGDFKESSYPLPYDLEFKVGAQIMFVKNDPSGDQQFYNGKIGKIVSLSDNEIEVGFKDTQETVIVEKYQWENIKYQLDPATNDIMESVKGTFTTYPIKLAWAITVHKSQGLSFDKAVLDLEGAFASGQVYVALSRLRSLDGLVLTSKINLDSLRKNHQVSSYATRNKQGLDALEKNANLAARLYLKDYLMEVFDFRRLLEELKDHVISYNEKKKKTVKSDHAQWAMDRYKEVEKLQPAAGSFQSQIQRVLSEEKDDYLAFITTRVVAAKDYFGPVFKGYSKAVFDHIDELKKAKGTKAYVKELLGVETLFFDKQMQFQKAIALCDSLIANTMLTKEKVAVLQEDERAVKIATASKKSGSSRSVRASVVGPKVNTKLVSFEMYKEGKSIKEIAKERDYNVQTIEGHLAYYVGQGDLDALEFVSLEKLQVVKQKFKELKTDKLGELKEALGSDYSYAEIKFGLASMD
ncbi:MAG: hypothetical protein ACJA0Q_000758 [Saprospiraceae bacterium]|jgi:uncharacterized protein YpbB